VDGHIEKMCQRHSYGGTKKPKPDSTPHLEGFKSHSLEWGMCNCLKDKMLRISDKVLIVNYYSRFLLMRYNNNLMGFSIA